MTSYVANDPFKVHQLTIANQFRSPLDNCSQSANILVDRNTVTKETLEKETLCTVKPVELS